MQTLPYTSQLEKWACFFQCEGWPEKGKERGDLSSSSRDEAQRYGAERIQQYTKLSLQEIDALD